MEREREKGLGENETWFKFGKKLLQDPELTKSWNLNFFVKSSRKILHYQQTTTSLVEILTQQISVIAATICFNILVHWPIIVVVLPIYVLGLLKHLTIDKSTKLVFFALLVLHQTYR